MTTPANYARPDTLVSTEWVANHLQDKKVRFVEVDVDTTSYQQGHVPGAIGWNWTTQLCDTVVRDVIPRAKLEVLMAASSIGNETTVVLYGDNNNWFAAWALWQLKLYGHEDVRIMNGGRKKWVAESRPMSTEEPRFEAARYVARRPDLSLRAFLPEVQQVVQRNGTALVDVRSLQEFTGEILSPPGLPETCQRGGHIPGAKSIPWAKACNEDGTFKSYEELAQLYEGAGVARDKPVIAVLQDRRAVQPHLVRPEVFVGIPRREELRRIVDRVGEPRWSAGGKIVKATAHS